MDAMFDSLNRTCQDSLRSELFPSPLQSPLPRVFKIHAIAVMVYGL